MSETAAPSKDHLRVVVRPLPKVIFFWMTWLMSLFCAFTPDPGAGAGLIWVGVFFFNTLVISFDFNEERSLVFVLTLIATFVVLLYLNILGPVSTWFMSLEPSMNNTFYWIMFTGFSVVYFFVWLRSRFDYWVFRPNEVLHRYGVFPKIRRYSTESLRWDKQVPDMLERLLGTTGRIVLTSPHEPHPVIIEHVPRIGSVDDRIANILGVRRVVTASPDTASLDA